MNSRHLLNRLWMAVCLYALSTALYAQSTDFEPHSGQSGKDVIWLPTSQSLVDKMLDMANVTSSDFLMDLGSGDGRLVITAAKRGANALGIEYNPDMVEFSKKNADKEGVSSRAKFKKADLFEEDLSKATVITLFLLPELNLRLRPKLLELKPGTRIVSNSFSMDDWEADARETVEDDCISYCTALLWIVPAKVAGKWKMEQGELTLNQEFQMISGNLKTGNKTSSISDGRLKGAEITFEVDGVTYKGTVTGNRIQGNYVAKGQNKSWAATKM